MDVPIRCVCPPKADGSPRHEGDTVTLRETLGFREVTTIRGLVSQVDHEDSAFYIAEVQATLDEGYVLFGIESWTLRYDAPDDKERMRYDVPLPVSRANIREHLLTAVDAAADVSDAADNLYGDKVILPLLARSAPKSLPDSPTDTSTSPKTGSSDSTRPTPLKRSSTGSSRTAGTATTSSLPDGASSSSPSSASVA